ncbi:hypothetical protein JW877_08780 [bacterium]|nr:hypothetical protein [bacterium]
MRKTLFLLKFLGITVLAFFVWAFALEGYYLRIIGHIMAIISRIIPIFKGQIDVLWVKGEDILFRVYALRADLKIAVGGLTANIIPFTALTLATKLDKKSKIVGLGLGYLILVIFHIIALSIILILYISQSSTINGIKIFMDGVFLTLLPIALWFLLILRKKGGINNFISEFSRKNR